MLKVKKLLNSFYPLYSLAAKATSLKSLYLLRYAFHVIKYDLNTMFNIFEY